MIERCHFSPRLVPWSFAGLALMVCAGFGCSSAEASAETPEAEPARMPGPSGAACPDRAPTYDGFAAEFLESYCVRCHSSTLSGADRHGAPRATNLDTLEGAQAASLEMLDQLAAAGPLQENSFMPPGESGGPSREERERLGQWLACGRP